MKRSRLERGLRRAGYRGRAIRGRAIRGQAMVEYLVVASVAVALLVPFPPSNTSAAEEVLAAIKTGYAKFLAAISVPQ